MQVRNMRVYLTPVCDVPPQRFADAQKLLDSGRHESMVFLREREGLAAADLLLPGPQYGVAGPRQHHVPTCLLSFLSPLQSL